MEITLLGQAASLGVGFFVAVMVLLWKRADDVRYQASLESFVKLNQEYARQSLEVVRENTTALRGIESAMAAMSAALDLGKQLRELEREVRGHAIGEKRTGD